MLLSMPPAIRRTCLALLSIIQDERRAIGRPKGLWDDLIRSSMGKAILVKNVERDFQSHNYFSTDSTVPTKWASS